MNAVHAKRVCGMNVGEQVVKERGSSGRGIQAGHGEFVNRRVWLAYLNLVAVDNGVEYVFVVHERPPHWPKFLHVVCQNPNRYSSRFQVMDESDHLIVELKVERVGT